MYPVHILLPLILLRPILFIYVVFFSSEPRSNAEIKNFASVANLLQNLTQCKIEIARQEGDLLGDHDIKNEKFYRIRNKMLFKIFVFSFFFFTAENKIKIFLEIILFCTNFTANPEMKNM